MSEVRLLKHFPGLLHFFKAPNQPHPALRVLLFLRWSLSLPGMSQSTRLVSECASGRLFHSRRLPPGGHSNPPGPGRRSGPTPGERSQSRPGSRHRALLASPGGRGGRAEGRAGRTPPSPGDEPARCGPGAGCQRGGDSRPRRPTPTPRRAPAPLRPRRPPSRSSRRSSRSAAAPSAPAAPLGPAGRPPGTARAPAGRAPRASPLPECPSP